MQIRWSGGMVVAALFMSISAASPAAEQSAQQPASSVGEDGTVRATLFELPLSIYMSAEAKRRFITEDRNPPGLREAISSGDIARLRSTMDRIYFNPMLDRVRARYAVQVSEQRLAGIRTDVVVPTAGIATANRKRVLINVHGGGFSVGAGAAALVESVPVAAVAGIKVISVDYRQGPEHRFPAASEDVAAVYRELLKQYRPENIGIYGCSAGGLLTAMVVAWLQKEQLPMPGAVGIFCAGAQATFGGDSRFFANVAMGEPPLPASPNPPPFPMEYLSEANLEDPLVSPVFSPAVLAGFPPTLLITGTRAMELSAVAYTHGQLIKAGALADLHVWDGMGHCFFYDSELPESRDAFAVIGRFFADRLGKRPR